MTRAEPNLKRPLPPPAFDVVGLGAAVVDLLALVPRFPERDSKLAILELSHQGGGLVGTALVALARLGCRARYVGRLGDDDHSEFILADFAREGVDTTAVTRRAGEKARFAFVIVEAETGLRTILHTAHASAAVDPASLDRQTILAARSLLVDCTDPPAARRCVEWMRAAGRPTLIDADHYSPEAHAVARDCDYVVASHRYATACTGRDDPAAAARALASDVPGAVVVTAGRDGASVVARGEEWRQPAFLVPVKDTTGAGDVFHGAFLCGVLRGWDLRRTVAFAAAAAALKCRSLGGRAGIASLAETARFLVQHGHAAFAELETPADPV
jgi:sugar/nucleoside kinase (ribokinase family)